MKKFKILFLLFAVNSFIFAQQTPKPNYRAAAKYSPKKIAKMVHSTSVRPHWLKKGNRFWYQYKTSQGANYYIVDADKRTRKKIFDPVKMAKWLTEITKDPYDSKHLPKFNFKFNENETAIRFRVTSNEEIAVKENEDKKDKTEKKGKKNKTPKMEKKIYHLQYKLGDNKLTILDNKKKEKEKWRKWANISPDGKIVLFSKNYNIYWMDKENFEKAMKNEKDTTVVEHQWTKDGVQHFGYGGNSWGKDDQTKIKDKDKRQYLSGAWSHDSKKFIFKKYDSRHIKDLWVINSVDGRRPKLETYKYHMAGEQDFYKGELLIFDIKSKGVKRVKLDTVQQHINFYIKPLKKVDQNNDYNPTILLSKKGKIYYQTTSRDRKRINICVADIETGESKVLIKEAMNTYVESRPLVLLNNEKEMLHWSERDGWAHFYLYTTTGKLKRQITKGEFHTHRFKGIDEDNRVLYFSAHGVDKNHDPYYEHLYKINLNGRNMKQLNAGNFDTRTNISDSNEYFISNYSRVNTIPKSELRNANGKVILKLEEADLSQLFASGYKFPKPFKVKAADGITDLYGVMYKPFDFDENKNYPLIEYVYPGPQTEAVNKSFSHRMNRLDRVAQLGFVVISLGNRGGNPNRSKWYHNYGYGNLRDYGLADKKYVAEQLADKYKFIDISKVGIFGHSGGGFMSTAAMLVYPDFFKAAYSSAGNHDNNVYNSWWSETHHGIKEKKNANGKIHYEYNIDTNHSIAKNLKGHLMLVHGDMDNNVHPAGTIRMVNALIKANKRFSFMILPTQRHGFGSMTEYAFWLRADHFCKYLLGVDTKSVDITSMNRDISQNR